MLALHCCAIQGRDDVIELLLRYDTRQLQKKDLAMENQVNDFCIIMYICQSLHVYRLISFLRSNLRDLSLFIDWGIGGFLGDHSVRSRQRGDVRNF